MANEYDLTTINACPSGLVEDIVSEQTLLERFHFELTGGNSSLATAKIICLTDTFHEAPDHSNFGALIAATHTDSDITFVETVDVTFSQREFGIPEGVTTLLTWEDPELYYRAILLQDRRNSVDRLILFTGFAENTHELRRNREAWEALEAGDETIRDQLVTESSTSTLLERLKRAKQILDARMAEIIDTPRNIHMVSILNATMDHLQEDQKIYLIAGSMHFTPEVIAFLQQFQFIILAPNNLPTPSRRELIQLGQPLSPAFRAEFKRRWLAARRAKNNN